MPCHQCQVCNDTLNSKKEYVRHVKKGCAVPLKELKNSVPLRVAGLFCGCGGLDYYFHNNPSFTIVYANDFDKDSCDSYENNLKYKPELEDIKKLSTIPDCDVMLGGFPCQGFSIANINRSESDSRNDLYKELIRLLKAKTPKYFVFENVKGIMSLGGYENNSDRKSGTGKVMKMIISDFKNCGYNVKARLFRMKYFDIPQNRERVIFVGIRNDLQKEVIWPIGNSTITKVLRDAIGDLPIEYKPKQQHIGTKHKVKITGHMGNRKLSWDEISPTITGRGGGTGGPVINVHPSQSRRMTVREYARIQTFPDDFTFSGSVSSMYRQIGNAVPPRFSKHLANMIVDIENS